MFGEQVHSIGQIVLPAKFRMLDSTLSNEIALKKIYLVQLGFHVNR